VRTFSIIVLSLAFALGCDDDPGVDAGPTGEDAGPPEADAGSDAGAPDAGTDAGAPDAGTPCDGPPGLYEEGTGCTVVAAGLRLYTPQFELWADGASKERYVFLPPGTQIDTSDPDHWIYPQGTRFYKTFSIGGLRLETRILEKTGPSSAVGQGEWEWSVYAWNMDQDSVTDVTNTAPMVRQNVLGTDHDIPSGADCVRCHIGQGAHDMVNGFSAFQINWDGAGVSYADLQTEGRIANPFAAADAVVPGDATAVEALGWLHTNCGYCHRPEGDASAILGGFFMRLAVGSSGLVEGTRTYMTGVNRPSSISFGDARCRIMPGNATNSVAYHRMSSREAGVQMPPLATESAPIPGMNAVGPWIDSLSVAVDPACTP